MTSQPLGTTPVTTAFAGVFSSPRESRRPENKKTSLSSAPPLCSRTLSATVSETNAPMAEKLNVSTALLTGKQSSLVVLPRLHLSSAAQHSRCSMSAAAADRSMNPKAVSKLIVPKHKEIFSKEWDTRIKERTYDLNLVTKQMSVYEPLLDDALTDYFQNPKTRRHLQTLGLVDENGAIIDDITFKYAQIKLQKQQYERQVLKSEQERELDREVEMVIRNKEKYDSILAQQRFHKLYNPKTNQPHPEFLVNYPVTMWKTALLYAKRPPSSIISSPGKRKRPKQGPSKHARTDSETVLALFTNARRQFEMGNMDACQAVLFDIISTIRRIHGEIPMKPKDEGHIAVSKSIQEAIDKSGIQITDCERLLIGYIQKLGGDAETVLQHLRKGREETSSKPPLVPETASQQLAPQPPVSAQRPQSARPSRHAQFPSAANLGQDSTASAPVVPQQQQHTGRPQSARKTRDAVPQKDGSSFSISDNDATGCGDTSQSVHFSRPSSARPNRSAAYPVHGEFGSEFGVSSVGDRATSAFQESVFSNSDAPVEAGSIEPVDRDKTTGGSVTNFESRPSDDISLNAYQNEESGNEVGVLLENSMQIDDKSRVSRKSSRHSSESCLPLTDTREDAEKGDMVDSATCITAERTPFEIENASPSSNMEQNDDQVEPNKALESVDKPDGLQAAPNHDSAVNSVLMEQDAEALALAEASYLQDSEINQNEEAGENFEVSSSQPADREAAIDPNQSASGESIKPISSFLTQKDLDGMFKSDSFRFVAKTGRTNSEIRSNSRINSGNNSQDLLVDGDGTQFEDPFYDMQDQTYGNNDDDDNSVTPSFNQQTESHLQDEEYKNELIGNLDSENDAKNSTDSAGENDYRIMNTESSNVLNFNSENMASQEFVNEPENRESQNDGEQANVGFPEETSNFDYVAESNNPGTGSRSSYVALASAIPQSNSELRTSSSVLQPIDDPKLQICPHDEGEGDETRHELPNEPEADSTEILHESNETGSHHISEKPAAAEAEDQQSPEDFGATAPTVLQSAVPAESDYDPQATENSTKEIDETFVSSRHDSEVNARLSRKESKLSDAGSVQEIAKASPAMYSPTSMVRNGSSAANLDLIGRTTKSIRSGSAKLIAGSTQTIPVDKDSTPDSEYCAENQENIVGPQIDSDSQQAVCPEDMNLPARDPEVRIDETSIIRQSSESLSQPGEVQSSNPLARDEMNAGITDSVENGVFAGNEVHGAEPLDEPAESLQGKDVISTKSDSVQEFPAPAELMVSKSLIEESDSLESSRASVHCEVEDSLIHAQEFGSVERVEKIALRESAANLTGSTAVSTSEKVKSEELLAIELQNEETVLKESRQQSIEHIANETNSCDSAANFEELGERTNSQFERIKSLEELKSIENLLGDPNTQERIPEEEKIEATVRMSMHEMHNDFQDELRHSDTAGLLSHAVQ
ncbi:hypothetical protein HDU83_007404 [Entophlyctis luteolus]|nr:hypothetical protein HDU83_007404 [Entophlyctis luteolus]